MANQESDIELSQKLYTELRKCAHRILSGGVNNGTLQATEVVHEACIRLIESPANYQSESHIYGSAAKAMRHLMIDYARAKSAKKRGQRVLKTVVMDDLLTNLDESEGLLMIDQILSNMGKVSSRLESIAELYYFVGLSKDEIAKIQSLSVRTVERELKFARVYLSEQLKEI